MFDRFPWSTAAKIAWRESRSSPVKFAFVILAVAIGVGSLTGVRGFSTAFQQMLVREARTLMAADVTVRIFVMPTDEQERVIESLVARGVRETQITETLTMVSAASSPAAPVLVSAKAVDPAAYPFYGEIRFDPPGPIAQVLTPDTVAMAPDLMLRLDVQVGDTIRLGGQDYKLAAAVVSEPDRMSGSLNIGLRLMMSRDALARTGLLSAGSRAAQRFLFQLGGPGTPDVETVRTELKNAFPDAQVIDFRETHPIITRGLERSTTFLSMVSLIALIVGALGVATAMHAHLQQKLDSIAVMKCLGARSQQIIRIYLIQTLGLGLAGGLLGVGIGALVQLAFPHLISRYFQIATRFAWDWPSILQGLAAGVLSTLLFTLPPLLSIREIRPNLILRREMADANPGWRERLRRGRASIAAGAVILTGMAALAGWLSASKPQDAFRLGVYFAGGILVTLAALMLVAAALLAMIRRLLRARAARIPASWRHGMANLYRPGNQARAVLVAMGLGVMFTATIYLVQRSMLEEIAANAPPGMPNVFLLDIQPAQRDAVVEFVNRQPSLEKPLELVPSVAARLTAVNGTPVEQLPLQGWGRRFRQTRTVTWSRSVPEATEVLAGKWWDTDVRGQVSVAEDAAKVLNVQPGARLDFIASGVPVSAEVAAIHRTEAVRVGATNEFIFTESTLKDLPVIYYGGLRMRPADVGALQRGLYQAHPTVTVVNVADVIQTIQEVVDQIALVVRFISAFAILAGVIILASSVAGTRFRRIREVVILKTLGGTRRRIGQIFSIEFLLLGATAGLMGGLLASGFANVIFVRFFKGDLAFDPLPVLVATVAGAILANLAGWAASARILSSKPLEILRAE